MPVRFDDSLPILVDLLVEELGQNAMRSGVVLRDAGGALAFFSRTQLTQVVSKRVSARLRKRLGPYARSDRVLVNPSEIGADDILSDPSAMTVQVSDQAIRLIDRRIVGADWLRMPAPAAPPPARVVFSSLKGGVGRSTALCVAAAELASRGRRVLAVDLDMEAPGLGAMLLDRKTVPEFGLLDALVESGFAPLDERFLADLTGPSRLGDRRGKIDVLPAFGRRSLQHPENVLAKIARAYAESVQPDGIVATILDQVRSIIDSFSDPKRYDAIFVDSRAGLHETAASAILGLGAEVLLFGLDEAQTFQGYSALFAHLARFVPRGIAPEWLERLTMVHGKAPSDADDRIKFSERCRQLLFDSGLARTKPQTDGVPLPAAPFKDVPWDDEIADEELLFDELWMNYGPIAILDDERFRYFDPFARKDLLSERVYRSSFGSFLKHINEIVSAETDDTE